MAGNRRFDSLGPADAVAVLVLATGVALMKRFRPRRPWFGI